jgi:hypothetical protein
VPDATRDEAIAWSRAHARDGFWHKALMKFPPPDGWAWCGDRAPYHLAWIAFCDPTDYADINESDIAAHPTPEAKP